MVSQNRKMILFASFLAFAVLISFFLSSGVVSKSLPINSSSAANPVRGPIFSNNISVAPICNLSYTDITSLVSQKLSQALPLANGSRFGVKMMGDRFALFNVYDAGYSFFSYYVYDSGIDGLWLTNDDKAYFVMNTSLTGSNLYGMVSENGTVANFYWSFYDYQTSPQASYIHRCTLTPQGCTPQFVTYVFDSQLEVLSLVPLDSQNRLYMAIEENSLTPQTKGIFSCYLLPNALDSCSLGYSDFIQHANYTDLPDNFKDLGFTYRPNYSAANEYFFSAVSQYSLPLPINAAVNPYMSTYLGSVFFTYRFYPFNTSLIDFYVVDTSSGQGSILSTDTTGISPILVEHDSSDILYVYSRYRPGLYQQFVKRFIGGQVSEIYRSNTHVNVPIPLTIQNDKFIIGTVATPTGARIYRSNCLG